MPDKVIREIILQMLRRYGQTTRAELIKSTAKQLGFQRTGRKIQQRLDAAIELMSNRGELVWGTEGGITAF